MPKVVKINALTPLQEGFLFHSLYGASEANYYFYQTSFYLEGSINLELLKEAWQKIVERHEVFRTDIRWRESKVPVQIVLNEKAAEIYETDLSQLAADAQAEYIQRLKAEDAARKFDFEAGKLSRIHLVKLSPAQIYVCWNFHHIILDGWSMSIVIGEFLQIYQALTRGLPLPDAPRSQFSDYLTWYKKQNSEAGLQFWQRYLAELRRPTYLPFDRSAGTEKYITRTGTYDLELSPELTRQVQQLCREQNITTNVLIQTIWGLLLQKYNQTNISCYGMTTNGRPVDIPAVEGVVGLFINTVPVVIRTRTGQTLQELLQQTSQELHQGKMYEHLPLTKIKKVSRLDAAVELFDSIVVFQNLPVDSVLAEMQFDFTARLDELNEMTNYDLTLDVILGETIVLHFLFNLDLFTPAFFQMVAQHVVQLLETAVTTPDMLIQDIHICQGAGWRLKNAEDQIDVQPIPESLYVEPRKEMEQILSRVFAEILHVERVSIDASFFELGGDSLMVMQVVAQLLKLELYLEIKDLVEHPTVRELAERVQRVLKRGEENISFQRQKPVLYRDCAALAFRLPLAETERFFHTILPSLSMESQTVYLMGLCLALREWSGKRQFLINIESYSSPVWIDLSEDEELYSHLKQIRQVCEQIPRQAGALSPEKLHSQPEFGFALSTSAASVQETGLNQFPYNLKVNAENLDCQLTFTFAYYPGEHTVDEIARLVGSFATNLRKTLDFLQNNLIGTTQLITAESKLLLKLNSCSGEKNIFCIHPSGGSALCYKELAGLLEGYNFYGIRAAGMLPGEEMPVTALTMAERYYREIKSIQKTGPYIISGYSFGAYAGFELALLLERLGEEVGRLILIEEPPLYPGLELDLEMDLRLDIMEIIKQTGVQIADPDQLSIDELLETLASNEDFQKQDTYLSLESMMLLKKIWQNHAQIAMEINRKEPGNVLKSDIYYIKAEQGIEPYRLGDSWGHWTRGQLFISELPGDHFRIIKKPYVEGLAKVIRGIVQ